jgi:flagellar L-ring protein precursor FlgH
VKSGIRKNLAAIGFGVTALVWSACTCRGDDKPARPNGSLFSEATASLTSDFRARKVGDTLTILVQESATASSSADTKTSRNDAVNFGGLTGSLGGIFGQLGLTKGLLSPAGVSANTATAGSGATNRSGSLVTKITVIVKEIQPNGNLVVEGNRTVGVNAEKQKVTITGIIRPQDVGPDNTVSSVALANAQIHYDGKGPVGDKQRRGLLTTIFGWLF